MENKKEIVENIISILTKDEKQLLKDTIIEGDWGDGSEYFINNNGEKEEYMMYAYCTNDVSKAGNFSGKKISSLFRSMYGKLCNEHGVGEYISHCSDWWGDGKGDMLFIREEVIDEFEDWAYERK